MIRKHVLPRIGGAVLTWLAVCSNGAAADSYTLTCSGADDPAAEKVLFKQAPKGASRTGPHAIAVNWADGVKRFADVAAHGNQDETHWTYCGYNKANDIHLVGKSDGQTFTGDVVFGKDGKSFVAGHSIVVSPDGKSILAVEQEDGMYGELWIQYDIAGAKIWHGYAGFKRKKPEFKADSIVALLAEPGWDANNNLTAKVTECENKKFTGRVTLQKVDGAWQWLPAVHC